MLVASSPGEPALGVVGELGEEASRRGETQLTVRAVPEHGDSGEPGRPDLEQAAVPGPVGHVRFGESGQLLVEPDFTEKTGLDQCYKTFYGRMMNVYNMLECFPRKPFQPSLMLPSKAGAP